MFSDITKESEKKKDIINFVCILYYMTDRQTDKKMYRIFAHRSKENQKKIPISNSI